MKRSFVVACVLALTLVLGLSASASASARVAKKGKSCPGKKSGKGCAKGKAKGAALKDGTYEDAAQSLTLTVTAGKAVLRYSLPSFCDEAVDYTSKPAALTASGDTWKASENRYFNLFGEPATAKWSLSVKKAGLQYSLSFKLEGKAPVGPCEGRGNPSGSLTKVG